MEIVITPGSFKESLSTEKCYQAVETGFSTIFPDARYICLPITDGGKGTVEAMVAATGGSIVTLEVYGPMGETVNAFYGLTGDGGTAVTEMAAANGLMLVTPEKRNPLLASSSGTGELARHTLDNGTRHIILDIGGSATVNGSMGTAQALGMRFLDTDGQMLTANGGSLARVASTETDECDPRLANRHIGVVCDVGNPLVGTCDAAAVFGPQEGATPEMVKELEQGLQNYTHVLQQQTEINVCQITGGDAADDMSIVATVFLNADIKPGTKTVLNTVNLAQAVQGATLAITGEGRINSQTADGKTPLDMVSVAEQFNVSVIGIAGVLGDGMEVVHQYGIDTAFSILPHLAPLAEALTSGKTDLFNSA